MARIGIICAIVIALGGSFIMSAGADESVAGEWKGTYTGTGQERLEFYLTLKQEGEKVTGQYFNPGAGAQMRPINREIVGTFKDGVFVWGKFNGAVTGDTMTGTFPAQVGPILKFTAVRTKK